MEGTSVFHFCLRDYHLWDFIYDFMNSKSNKKHHSNTPETPDEKCVSKLVARSLQNRRQENDAFLQVGNPANSRDCGHFQVDPSLNFRGVDWFFSLFPLMVTNHHRISGPLARANFWSYLKMEREPFGASWWQMMTLDGGCCGICIAHMDAMGDVTLLFDPCTNKSISSLKTLSDFWVFLGFEVTKQHLIMLS